MSQIPRYDTMSFSWLMKSTPVENSVNSPTKTPNMTHLQKAKGCEMTMHEWAKQQVAFKAVFV